MRSLIFLSTLLIAVPASAQEVDPRSRFAEILARVRAARPELDPDRIVRSGIDAMLATLDARTRYLTRADMAASHAARPAPQPVTAALLEGVVVVAVPAFIKDTPSAIATRLVEGDAKAARAIILDLRGNVGGLFDHVVAVADLFLDNGEIVVQRGRLPDDVQRYTASKRDGIERRPLAILVDRNTAAGAEIIAAALQARGRARVIGERTMGAGTVQTLLPLSSTTALSLTTSRVFAPGETAIDGVGVTPNIATDSAGALAAALEQLRP